MESGAVGNLQVKARNTQKREPDSVVTTYRAPSLARPPGGGGVSV